MTWFLSTSIGRTIAGAGLAIVVAAIIFWRVFAAGKRSAVGEAALTAARRAQEANRARSEAAKKPTPKEEANDPFNRDRR